MFQAALKEAIDWRSLNLETGSNFVAHDHSRSPVFESRAQRLCQTFVTECPQSLGSIAVYPHTIYLDPR